jgi:hypothetical protein
VEAAKAADTAVSDFGTLADLVDTLNADLALGIDLETASIAEIETALQDVDQDPTTTSLTDDDIADLNAAIDGLASLSADPATADKTLSEVETDLESAVADLDEAADQSLEDAANKSIDPADFDTVQSEVNDLLGID